MTTRLELICHASTSATRQAAFALDEPLDDRGLAQASAMAVTPPPVSKGSALRGLALTGPALRCEQTAGALGLRVQVDPDLADWELGSWKGLALADLGATNPDEVAAWMTDPAAAPHGGESLDDLLQRAGGWLDRLADHEGKVTAITHAAVIRATVVHALGAPPDAFWRLDVGPLARVWLTGRAGRWNLSFPIVAA